MNKRVSLILLVLGAVIIIVGLALMLVIVPGMKMLPDDVDITRQYNVEFLTLLDAETLTFARYAPGENPNLHIDRHAVAEEVDGEKILIREEQTLLDGETVLASQLKLYPLDRKSMELLQDGIPEDWKKEGYWEREGLVIGWPIDTEQKDYNGWSDDYRSPVVLKYDSEQEHGGIDTYYFTSESDPQPIDPADVERLGLPTSISADALATLASSIDVEGVELSFASRIKLLSFIQEAVAETQPEGVEGIPLVYYYDYKGEYWVEPQTGVLIDTRKYEHRAASFPPEMMEAIQAKLDAQPDTAAADYLPPEILGSLFPITVNEFVYQGTEDSVQNAREDAEDAISQLTLYGQTLPIGLIVVGVLLGLVGGYGLRKQT